MKVKLRKGTYNRRGEPLKYEIFEVECRGSGVKDNPVIIDSSSDIPNNFEIIESEIYITIENCQIKYLVLGYCKNIAIQNCSLRSLFLSACSDIRIDKCKSSFVNLINCQNCFLLDSIFDTELKLFKCYKNTIKNCEWDLFFDSDNLSRENKLENISHPWIDDILEIQNPLEKSGESFAITTRNFLKDIECKGTGTVNDPIIIEHLSVKKAGLKDLTLYHNRHYIILKKINLKKISLFDTKHVTLENCDLSKSLNLKFCSDINMNFISAKKLKFGACKDIFITNSNINKIDFYKGYIAEDSKLKENNVYEGYGAVITLKNCQCKKINEKAFKNIEIL